MGYYKFTYGESTILDLSLDTVTSATLQSGYTAHNMNGDPVVGTLVPGTDITSDTVVSSAMLSGYTAHNSAGSAISGTIPEMSTISGTISNCSEAFPIASGFYSVAGFVGVDSTNIEPSNIRSGVSILGVEGTMGAYVAIDPSVTIGSINSNGILDCIDYNEGIYAGIEGIYSPSVIKGIASYAFAGSSTLREITCESVSYIGEYAFANCPSLRTVSFPNCVYISSHAFEFAGLSEIELPLLSTSRWDYYEGIFYSCSMMEYASLPLITRIEENMFNNCYNLAEIYAPSVLEISGFAFYNCSRLTSVDFPLVNEIYEDAFAYTALYSITLPNATYLGNCAFEYCNYLSEVYLPYSSDFISFGSTVFAGCSNLSAIYVDSDMYSYYTTESEYSEYWSLFASIV